jgi:hypothetical protein
MNILMTLNNTLCSVCKNYQKFTKENRITENNQCSVTDCQNKNNTGVKLCCNVVYITDGEYGSCWEWQYYGFECHTCLFK